MVRAVSAKAGWAVTSDLFAIDEDAPAVFGDRVEILLPGAQAARQCARPCKVRS